MRATVDVDTLKDAAAWASKRTSSRPYLPALAGVLLTVHAEDTLTLDATDQVAAGTATIRCDTVEAGEALVNAGVLAAISAQLPGDVAKVYVEGERVRVTAGTARFSLRLMERQDVPSLPVVDQPPALVDGQALAAVLTAVAPAAARDDARPILMGTNLEAGGGRLVVAATDSYRLHVASLHWPGDDCTALVPADVARVVAKDCAGDKVEVAVDHARAMFGMGPRGVTSQQIEGRYPDWRQLVPSDRSHRVTVQGPELAQAVRRCAAVAPEQSAGGSLIRVRFVDDSVTVSADDHGSDGVDTVEADTDGADLTIGANSKYVLDAIAAVAPEGGDVTVDLTDDLKPFVLRASAFDGPDDPFALIMPVRL